MLKKFGRKALSLLLVFVLVATTFFIFDPSILLPKSKAVVDVKKLVNTVEPTVKFYVPEAIYLNPVVGTGSKPYSFQYFIDSDENGTLRRSATQTTGTVYFSCSAACTSITINWGNSVSPNVTENTHTNQIVKQTITGGTTSVRDGSVKVTATYVVDGKPHYAYAYTYMYYPDLDLLTGVAGSYVYKSSIGNEPKLSAFAFITGVHKVGNTTTYNDTERGVSNYYDQYNINSSKGAYGLSPLIPGWASVWSGGELGTGPAGALFKTADGDANIYDRDTIYGERTTSLNSAFIEQGNGGVYFHNRDRGGTSRTFGSTNLAWGTLFVDTSRVTNFNQIPNLRGGFIVHRYDSSGTKGKLTSFQSTDGSITIMSEIDYRNGDGKGYGMTSAEALSGSPMNKDYTMESYFNYERKNSSGVHLRFDFGLKVRAVSKASLRSAYRAAIENGWQSATAANNGWSSSVQSQWVSAYNSFASALDTAGTVLGKPYATALEISSALSTLNSRVYSCNSIINANFKAGIDTDMLAPSYTFYVPETIYLAPSTSATKTFKYYVDRENSVNSSLRRGENTSGNIYFKCDKASSIKSLTLSDCSSVTIGATTSSSGTLSTTVSAGSLSAGLNPGEKKLLTWTIVYVADGVEYTTNAYTVAYAPWPTVISASSQGRNEHSGSKRSYIMQTTWISGIHSVIDNGSGSDGSGVYKYSPIISSSSIPTGAERNMGNLFNEGTGGSGFWKSNDNATCYGGRGALLVDTSRYSYYYQVPNLKVGLDFNIVHGNHDSNTTDLGIFTEGSTEQTTNLGSTQTGNDQNSYPRQIYNLNLGSRYIGSTNENLVVRGKTRFRNSGGGSSHESVSYVYLNVTKVNKSSLRSSYNTILSKGYQKSWYTSDTWDKYEKKLKEVALHLGDPTSKDTSGITDLQGFQDGLVRNSNGKTTAVHLRDGSSADYNGKTGSAIIGTTTESMSYTYGDTVYGYYNEIPGFTASRYSVTYGSTTKTSGVPQDSTHNNYYYIKNAATSNVDWKFWYTPNTYNIKYDPNGGTYNGTTGLTSSSVLFQSKYIVGKIGSATPANPTRPGCTFMGWKCSADGMVYQPGANINWEFLENVTFTAQWEYNSINLRFNENHDKLASNLLDPLVDGTISYDSTATITSTNDAGETVTTTKACNLKIEKLDDGTIRINGTLAGGYTFGFVPMDFEDGKQYVFSNIHISGSLTNGCMVIDPALSNGNNVSPRNQFDFGGSNSKTITVDSTYAGYRFWIWHNDGAGSYMTFNNYTFKPRIELKSDSTTVPTSSTEYNNIFADYIQYNTLIQELPTPTRTGYTFDGWYTQANGGTKVKVGDRLLYSDWNLNNTSQTLYAHWTINKYKLMYENEFDFDNFKFSMANPPVTNTNSPITINEHENSIQFTSQKRADGVTDDFTPTGQNYTSAETGYMTLVPGHTYEISYSYTVDKAASLNCYIFSYTSTSSTSWSTEYGNSGTGTYYNVGVAPSGATTGTMTGHYTVPQGRPYARLRFGSTTEGVTVKFSDICVRNLTDPMNYRGKSGGDGKENSLNKKFDNVTYKTTQSPLATITRQGYTFNGWYESENTSNGNGYGTQFTTSTAMPARDVPLYAQWKLNEYPIVINLNAPEDGGNDPATIGSFQYSKPSIDNGGIIKLNTNDSQQRVTTGSFNITVAYGTSFTLPIPSRNGWTFTGWTASTTPAYASLTNNGNTSASAYRVGAGGVTLTAHWSRNSYPVKAYAYGDIYNSATFALGRGGTVQIASDAAGTSVSKNIAYRSTTTLKATASTGYAFVGWYTDSALTNLYSKSASITSESVLMAGRTYYAKFKVQSYTITVNPDNATKGTTISGWYSAAGTAASSQTIKTSTEITMVYGSTLKMTAPEKTGYTFKGWSRTSGSTGTLNSTTGDSTYLCGAGAATLTAQWQINQYTITLHALANKFDTNTYSENGLGGTVQIDSRAANNKSTNATYNYNTTYTIKAAAYTGYKFEGWYTNPSLSGTAVSTSASYTTSLGASNITYYAKFSVQSYQITVNPNGATGGTNLSGWYSAPGTAASAINGVTSSRTITMVYGSTLKMTAPEKTGYTFKGWSRTSGSTGTLNSTTGDSTYLCGAGAATLTAQWQINQYTITLHALANKFDTNTYSENGLGGTVQIDSRAANNKSTNATYNYNTTYTIKAAAYTGYKFEGWYTNPSLSGTAVSTSASYTTSLGASNITYYAKFSVQSYQITVNPNGATGGTNLSGWYSAPGTAASAINGVTSSRTITMVYGSTLKMTAPEKTGYTFKGWSRTSGSTGTLNSTTGDSTYLCGAGEATLTAHWTTREYTITYIPNGGSVTPTSDTFTIESAINLPTPKREGYVFDGWMVTKAEGSWVKDTLYTGAKIDAGNYGNVTVTAQWSKIVNVYFYSGENKATVYTIPLTFKNGETTKQITAFGKGVDISGWKQEGWTTSTDANADVVKAKIAGGTSLNVDVNNGPFAYYAIYTQTQILKYNSNATEDKTVKNIPSPTNGTAYYNSFTSLDKATNVTHAIPSTVPTRSGYTFSEWNKNSDGTGAGYAAGGKFTNKNQTDTLYAQWKENKYTITYSYNGSGTADKSINYTITSAITIENAPTYKDHVFVGWKVTEVAAETSWTSGTLYVAGAKVGTGNFGNVKLVAQWVDISKAQENYSNEDYVDATIDVVIGVDKDNKQIVTTVQKFDNSNGQYTEYVNAKNAYDETMNALKKLQEEAVSKTGKDLIACGEKIKEAQKSFQAAVDALAGITLKERTVISDYLNNFRIDNTTTEHNLSEMNLNHYSKDVLNEVLNTLTAGANLNKEGRKITEKVNGKSYQTIMNEYVAKIADLFKNQKSTVKESKPAFEVYESVASINNSNDASLKAMAGVTAVNYVHTKKGATYYCYVNTKNPVILVTVNDIAGNSRVCYPTKAKVLKAEKSLESKEGVTASYSMANIHVTGDTSYDNYINNKIELNNKNASIGSNLSYYQQKQVIKLTPVFDGSSNGTVTYEFAATDDALKANVANQAKLSGDTSYSSTARYSLIDPKKPDTVDNRKYTTNENTIKIVVDYHVAEEIKDKNGNVTDYKKLDVTGDQVENDKWLNQYHLFRQSGGASNWELPKTGDKEYTVNDKSYGQTDRGSFTFTYELGALDIANGKLDTTDVNEIIALFKNSANYDNAVSCKFQGTKYQEVASNGQKIIRTDGKGVGYLPWGNNWSFNYYPKSQSYTYVHLVDRWGNVADKVFYVGNQDIKAVSVATASTDGSYTILEDGGSGIATLSLNAANVEILTDENSTIENNVYKTTGNVIRIRTGEANKSYTLSMKDKATNASTAALKSDENGIITLNVEDTAHKSGVYTFTLNGIEINLYDNVENDKYIVKVYDGEAEEGEAAELRVVTTGEVGKVRFTDTDGNTITVAASEKNDDGTKTWSMTKSKPAGEYEYSISVKVGYEWITENSKVKLTFTEKILDSGLIRSAEYDAESGLYKITIEGRATKIQFISEDGMTRTYTRYHDSVKSRKTYDEDGNEVNDTARTLDHEIWLVDAKIYSGQKYTVMGKFEAGWNREGTASLTAH